MIYLDSNILVSLFVADSNAATTREWYSRQSAPLAISGWTVAEVYSHIGLRRRKGEEMPQNAARTIDKFDALVATSFVLLKSSDAAILRASSWLRSTECSLQTSDALHLAIALENEAAAIATFDQRFARNIEKLRIGGLKVIALPTTGTAHKIQQKLADYNVTERDIAKAVKWARKRKTAERGKMPRMTVRG